MSSPLPALTVGIDIGSDKFIATVASQPNSKSAKIVRNALEHDNSPSVVAFTSNQRLVGETAKDQLRTNAKNAICDIPRLIGSTYEEYNRVSNGGNAFEVVDSEKGVVAAAQTPFRCMYALRIPIFGRSTVFFKVQ